MSIIQDWAANLGLRHQGVLVSAIRGCDTVERLDKSKYLVRMFRGVLLNPHCGDIKKSASFMLPFDEERWLNNGADFTRNIDHYPTHWIMHWLHACTIVGYKHPDATVRDAFAGMAESLSRKFHLLPETEEALDARLNADEKTFAIQQAS